MTAAQQAVYQYLLRYGYVVPYRPEDVPTDGKVSRSIGLAPPSDLRGFQDVLRGLLAAFDPSAAYTETNVLKMVNAPRCGCADMTVQGASRYGWPHKSIRYGESLTTLTGFTRQQIQTLYERAWQSWADVCGIQPVGGYSATTANLYAQSGYIDGAGKILAWSHLPVDASEATRLQQRYDSGENWGQYGADYLLGVMAHEIGHGLGLEHGSSGSLMQPYASAALTAPQAEDIARVRLLYGARTPTPTPTPDPTPNPTPTPTDSIVIEVGGKRYRVAATLLN